MHIKFDGKNEKIFLLAINNKFLLYMSLLNFNEVKTN